MTDERLAEIVSKAVKEVLDSRTCFCNLSGEGVSPATHVQHHREYEKLSSVAGKVKIGALLTISAAFISGGIQAIWIGIKHFLGAQP